MIHVLIYIWLMFSGPSSPAPVITIPDISESDITAIAQTVYGEARGCSRVQQEAVIWTILNRVDSSDFPNTIHEVVSQPNQFHGYQTYFPVTDELYMLSEHVITEWLYEKEGILITRTLPDDYLYFIGDGLENHFTTTYGGKDYFPL